MMEQSESIAKLAGALAQAQAQMSNATLNKTNPHFKSRYADLAAIRDAVIPPLSKNGIAVLQAVGAMDDGTPCLYTTLAHNSGEYVRSTYRLPATVRNQQEFGSALTYARRYSLAALCGISAEEDDDGNAEADGAQERPADNGQAPTNAGQGNNNNQPQSPQGRTYQLVDASGEVVHEFKGQGAADQVLANLEEYADSEPSIVHANRALLERAAGSKQKAFAERAQAILDKVDQPAEAAK